MVAIKVIVIRADHGKISEENVEETSLEEAAKKAAAKALEEWNPGASDFTALRSKYEMRYKLPIKPELFDTIRDLGLEMSREGNELVVEVPMIVISFDNEWLGDAYKDNRMYVVALYLDEEEARQLREYAEEATSKPKATATEEAELQLTEEELKRLEEGLEEIEEEKPKRKKRSKRRKKS